jgi:Flp pilus assembly protein TadG
MQPNKISHPTERGQSLVELALVFLFLLLLVGGIVDVGRLLFYSVALRDAAQEGVNFGALKPSKTTATSDVSDIVNRVRTSLDSSVIVDISYGDDGTKLAKDACTGDRIQVMVTQPSFEFIMPVISTFLGTTHINVNQSYAGTILRPACP